MCIIKLYLIIEIVSTQFETFQTITDYKGDSHAINNTAQKLQFSGNAYQ